MQLQEPLKVVFLHCTDYLKLFHKGGQVPPKTDGFRPSLRKAN